MTTTQRISVLTTLLSGRLGPTRAATPKALATAIVNGLATKGSLDPLLTPPFQALASVQRRQLAAAQATVASLTPIVAALPAVPQPAQPAQPASPAQPAPTSTIAPTVPPA